jgi:hypothetical protein
MFSWFCNSTPSSSPSKKKNKLIKNVVDVLKMILLLNYLNYFLYDRYFIRVFKCCNSQVSHTYIAPLLIGTRCVRKYEMNTEHLLFLAKHSTKEKTALRLWYSMKIENTPCLLCASKSCITKERKSCYFKCMKSGLI